MIKKIGLLLVLASTITTAQHSVKGFLSPNIKSDWVILYKVEGTQQKFINNTTIKKDSLLINGEKQAVGSFEIELPSYAKPGSYRATYRIEGEGFVDFFYNKNDVEFIFNPDYPQQSVAFTKGDDNKLYQNYLAEIVPAQEKIDSIQVAYLQDKTLNLSDAYKSAVANFNSVQNTYEQTSVNSIIAPFVKASPRINPSELIASAKEYLGQIKNTFFNKLDFNDKALVNSSFLLNRMLDYIFYINYSEDPKAQQNLYKTSIDTVLSKLESPSYKRDVIQFLITHFEASKNIEIIDYLFSNHYDKLPVNLINQEFKKEKEALFAAEVGRIAPDFSWSENGKRHQLSTLNDADNYILVFWSTSCSHCLREIPQLHEFMKDKSGYKVIAFALEEDAFVWENYKKTNLFGWHNVLGLKKWQNETARTYQVNSTPSYFVLDKSKKIVAKPYDIKEVKTLFE